MVGGSCFLPLSKTARSGVVLSFFLIWPRPEKTRDWLAASACLLGMLFSLAPDQPHFSSSSTCKVSPSAYRYCTNFNLPGYITSEGLQGIPTLAARSAGRERRNGPCRPIQLRFPFPPYSMIVLMSRRFHRFASSSSSRASDWQSTNRFELIVLKNMRIQFDHNDEQVPIEDGSGRCPRKADGLIAAFVWMLRELGVEVWHGGKRKLGEIRVLARAQNFLHV